MKVHLCQVFKAQKVAKNKALFRFILKKKEVKTMNEAMTNDEGAGRTIHFIAQRCRDALKNALDGKDEGVALAQGYSALGSIAKGLNGLSEALQDGEIDRVKHLAGQTLGETGALIEALKQTQKIADGGGNQ